MLKLITFDELSERNKRLRNVLRELVSEARRPPTDDRMESIQRHDRWRATLSYADFLLDEEDQCSN